MAIHPPKCRVCGVAEYRHLCAGAREIKTKAPVRPAMKPPTQKKAKKVRKP